MANDLTTNPWVIDTASSTPITTDDVYIHTIRWVGGTTAGHTAVVKDNRATPKVIYEGFATGANFVDERRFDGEELAANRAVGGIAVTTLSSGKVYLYLR